MIFSGMRLSLPLVKVPVPCGAARDNPQSCRDSTGRAPSAAPGVDTRAGSQCRETAWSPRGHVQGLGLPESGCRPAGSVASWLLRGLAGPGTSESTGFACVSARIR
jgi:hypothetical protein